jgi:hypothetical protein
MITKVLESSIISHEDNFTETMDGITTLFRFMAHDPIISKAPLCRSIMIMATFMIENVFWNAIQKFRDENETHRCCSKIIQDGIDNRIGISKAMVDWPELLVGVRFDYSSEPFTSITCLIDERNNIVHSNRISYYSYFIDTENGASSAYYTALMSAKSIWRHFFGIENEIYNSFEKTFPSPSNIYFQSALNNAKKISIRHLDPKDNPSGLKTLDEYEGLSSKIYENIVDEIFEVENKDTIQKALEVCEYPIKVTELFKMSYSNLPSDIKISALKMLSPLLRTLTKKKMLSCYGVNFGKALPHIKLGIKRIMFKNHHGYMCLPIKKHLVIFIIDTSTIELTDIIENV